jgi:predicted DNA-binding antitoxin AbrB/MazE fold protein
MSNRMSKTLDAIFDGEVLRPVGPVGLEPNTRVRITIEAEDEARPERESFLRTARSLHLEGPLDWSERVDDYLRDKTIANE